MFEDIPVIGSKTDFQQPQWFVSVGGHEWSVNPMVIVMGRLPLAYLLK
jgi:hypothetical protein